MYVAEVQIGNFRHLQDVHIGPLAPPGEKSDVVVLAGPNGGGKSSVLDLVCFALSTTWGWTWNVRRSFPESSFEIRFGLSELDLQRIEEDVRRDATTDPHGVLSELRSRRSYHRGFNFPDGEYAHATALHDQMHQLASRSLAEHTRAMFLRSDRYYSQQSYRRERIFESSRRLESSYWRSITFTLTDQQYADQVEFLIEQMYNYPRVVGQHLLDEETVGTGEPRPADPVAVYDELFQQLFQQYRLVRPKRGTVSPQDQLYIMLPNGVEVPFTDLSSGEQEVFFILSFFLRHDIRSSMVFVDEPELHLHPELVRRMIKIMLRVKPENQIWLGTHNAELIDEAGVDRTYFVYRPSPTEPGTVLRASDDEGFIRQLRMMFGYSGYVGLARKLVFLEGDASSADRRVLVNLFPEHADQIRFVPLNSSHNVLRVHRAVLSILSEGLGHCEFFLIRDRDYLPDEVIRKYEEDTSGKLFVLRRHEIENYLLDVPTIKEVLHTLGGVDLSQEEVQAALKDIARSLADKVLRDMVGARLNSHFQLHDCTIGNFEANREWLDASMAWGSSIVDGATERFRRQFSEAIREVNENAAPEDVDRQVAAAQDEIISALQSDGWKTLFPGKELLERFGTKYDFKRGPVFVNAVIRQLAEHPSRIDHELSEIMERITSS